MLILLVDMTDASNFLLSNTYTGPAVYLRASASSDSTALYKCCYYYYYYLTTCILSQHLKPYYEIKSSIYSKSKNDYLLENRTVNNSSCDSTEHSDISC